MRPKLRRNERFRITAQASDIPAMSDFDPLRTLVADWRLVADFSCVHDFRSARIDRRNAPVVHVEAVHWRPSEVASRHLQGNTADAPEPHDNGEASFGR